MPTNFDKVASIYNTLCSIVFGNNIKKAQYYFLNKIPENSSILIIGGGTGDFLSTLMHLKKPAQIVFIESSEKMLDICKSKLNIKCLSEIKFRKGTEDSLREEEMFDVIITYFFLDLFSDNELTRIMQKLNSHLKKGGMWLFSDFQVSKYSWRKYWQKILIQTMYLFFNITSGLKNNKLEDFGTYFGNLKLNSLYEVYLFKRMIYVCVYIK